MASRMTNGRSATLIVNSPLRHATGALAVSAGFAYVDRASRPPCRPGRGIGRPNPVNPGPTPARLAGAPFRSGRGAGPGRRARGNHRRRSGTGLLPDRRLRAHRPVHPRLGIRYPASRGRGHRLCTELSLIRRTATLVILVQLIMCDGVGGRAGVAGLSSSSTDRVLGPGCRRGWGQAAAGGLCPMVWVHSRSHAGAQGQRLGRCAGGSGRPVGDGDQPSAQARAPGAGVGWAGEGAGGVEQVVRDRSAPYSGGVGAEVSGR